LRVVVGDDNDDANASLSRLLEAPGFHVAGRAYDGLAGLKIIKATQPYVAIVDIAMPAAMAKRKNVASGIASAHCLKSKSVGEDFFVAL
jgi:DNA-binding response OmpR family regulator